MERCEKMTSRRAIIIYISFLTSLYFVQEITENSSSMIIFTSAYLLQWFHDWICLIFFELCFHSFYYKSLMDLIYLNMFHSIIMIQFCYFKRCVITLMYNWVLDIPMCNRYIPIWQRFFNVVSDIRGVCLSDDFRMTYIWLNNHMIQSTMVLLSNVHHYLKLYMK